MAHRAGARIYKSLGPSAPLKRIMAVENELGRSKDRDLTSSREGRTFSLTIPARSGTDGERLPHEIVADRFARELALTLESGRTHGNFDNLILVADPHFLGKLNHALSKQTAALVIGTLGKDLGRIDDRELSYHLKKLVDAWQDASRPTGT